MKADTLRAAALAILNTPDVKHTRKSGSFLGQCVVDETPLSDKQVDWFLKLADRAGVTVAEGIL